MNPISAVRGLTTFILFFTFLFSFLLFALCTPAGREITGFQERRSATTGYPHCQVSQTSVELHGVEQFVSSSLFRFLTTLPFTLLPSFRFEFLVFFLPLVFSPCSFFSVC